MDQLEKEILDAISDPKSTRKEVASLYRDGFANMDGIDWKKVNAAIKLRWSDSGLKYIKEMAWRFETVGRRLAMG